MKKLIAVFLCLFLLTGCTTSNNYTSDDYIVLQDKYESLSTSYDELLSSYDKVSSDLNHVHDDLTNIEDDLITLYCYFEKENGVTYSDGYNAINRMNKTLDEYYNPSHD